MYEIAVMKLVMLSSNQRKQNMLLVSSCLIHMATPHHHQLFCQSALLLQPNGIEPARQAGRVAHTCNPSYSGGQG